MVKQQELKKDFLNRNLRYLLFIINAFFNMKINLKDLLQHYTKDDEDFVRKVYNEAEKIYYQDSIKELGFCNPNQIKIVQDICKIFSLNILMDGGYKDAELKNILIFKNNYNYSIDNSILEVIYNKKFNQIKHNQVMGTLYNLGVNSNMIGDIVVSDDGDCQFVVSKNIVETILLMVNKYGNVKVEHKEIKQLTLKPKTLNSNIRSSRSLRLDSICKTVTQISRNKISKEIKKSKVRVNHKMITDVTTLIKEDDMISIEGYGRVIIKKIIPINGKYNIKFETTKI